MVLIVVLYDIQVSKVCQPIDSLKENVYKIDLNIAHLSPESQLYISELFDWIAARSVVGVPLQADV